MTRYAWTQDALDRIADLRPEFLKEFGMRKLMSRRPERWERAPDCLTFEDLERWFLERGVRVRIGTVTGGRLEFEMALLAEQNEKAEPTPEG